MIKEKLPSIFVILLTAVKDRFYICKATAGNFLMAQCLKDVILTESESVCCCVDFQSSNVYIEESMQQQLLI